MGVRLFFYCFVLLWGGMCPCVSCALDLLPFGVAVEGFLAQAKSLLCPAGQAFFAVSQRSKRNTRAAPLCTR